MSGIKIPNIPLTNTGLKSFLTALSSMVQNDDRQCKGYSVGGDPSGRVVITATFDCIGYGPHSLVLEVSPVVEDPE